MNILTCPRDILTASYKGNCTFGSNPDTPLSADLPSQEETRNERGQTKPQHAPEHHQHRQSKPLQQATARRQPDCGRICDSSGSRQTSCKWCRSRRWCRDSAAAAAGAAPSAAAVPPAAAAAPAVPASSPTAAPARWARPRRSRPRQPRLRRPWRRRSCAC